MRSFVIVYTLAVLGASVFLTVQYSFWVACVIMYSSTMLVVAVIAFVGGSRPSWKSNSKVLNDEPDEIIAEGQAVSDDLKAAWAVYSLFMFKTLNLATQKRVAFSYLSGKPTIWIFTFISHYLNIFITPYLLECDQTRRSKFLKRIENNKLPPGS